jgi:hypothetical protein
MKKFSELPMKKNELQKKKENKKKDKMLPILKE